MHRPVLVTPPEILPVSLEEAKKSLRVEHADDDLLIQGLVEAAVSHLDGWTGILGRCLVEQSWRQDFDAFARELCLPIGPVISVSGVTWRNEAGQVSTVAQSAFDLRTDAGGRSVVRFDADYQFPTGLHESRAVAVTFVAGYPTIPDVPGEEGPPEVAPVPAQSTVPAALKVAIMLMVGNWYENRESVVVGTTSSQLPFGAQMLIDQFKRVRV